MSAFARYTRIDGTVVPRFEDEEYSRREILIARDAYVFGGRDARNGLSGDLSQAAAERFPLPMVTRPRVVRDDSGPAGVYLWRVVEGKLQCVHEQNERFASWNTLVDLDSGMYLNAARIVLLAELIANPTETVEDPG